MITVYMIQNKNAHSWILPPAIEASFGVFESRDDALDALRANWRLGHEDSDLAMLRQYSVIHVEFHGWSLDSSD